MKSILIVIYAQYVVLIIDGKKTIEVRKNKNLANAIKKLIAEQGGCYVYIYVAKNGSRLLEIDDYELAGSNRFMLAKDCDYELKECSCDMLNGKIVARFWCNNVEEMINPYCPENTFATQTLTYEELLDFSQLTANELDTYIPKGKIGYAIHISKLEIFERPKELNEFTYLVKCKNCKSSCKSKDKKIVGCKNALTKAPQNFCYIEENEK